MDEGVGGGGWRRKVGGTGGRKVEEKKARL